MDGSGVHQNLLTGEQLLRVAAGLLPDGHEPCFQREVPVSGKSLSQNITGAVWSFDLISWSLRSISRWLEAVEALMAAEQLIWHDTDKKGRPRRSGTADRPCASWWIVDASDDQRVRLRLEAAVDPMGRSIRPSQIQHWLRLSSGALLQLHDLRRAIALQLAEC